MAKIIMHIDLNAFFATAEEIRDPSLANKPLVVGGSGRRGIVSTANYAARKYGIHSAMPTYMAERLYPRLIIKSPDFAYYSKLSDEFFTILRRFSPIQEIMSIDECFMDLTKPMKDVEDPIQYLTLIQQTIYNETKLQCSIGVGPTKFLAKMASNMKKPMGITILRRRDLAKMLWPLPIEEMYGIGKKTAPRLQEIGVKTIGDLAKNENPAIKAVLGKYYYSLVEWANGRGSDEVIAVAAPPKSIGNSTTFLNDTNNLDEILAMVLELTKEVSAHAKKEEQVGLTIQIIIKNADFSTINRSITLVEPTNEVDAIYQNAEKLFIDNYNGQFIRLVGVTLQNLTSIHQTTVQMSLFDFAAHEEENVTRLLINELNRKLKEPKLMRASELKKKKKEH